MFDLYGKKVLITGATGGIGQAIVQILKEAHAQVVLSSSNKERLEEVANKIAQKSVIIPANLNNRESLKSLIESAEQALGGHIDILINNAGVIKDNIAIRMKNIDWDTVININLTASFQLARYAIKNMLKQRYGRIINITSIIGFTGNPGQSNYAAAKAGIIGWSKSLAQEVAARGITVNCIAPGFIETKMSKDILNKHKEKILSRIPVKRTGSPREIASAVLYLASNEASYITGQTLHINGGMLMV